MVNNKKGGDVSSRRYQWGVLGGGVQQIISTINISTINILK